MAHPHLGFCPYLPLQAIVEFAGWEIGPLAAFAGRWSDAAFEARSTAFLRKFVQGNGKPPEHPSVLCRKGQALDGELPTPEEIDALQSALMFGFLDKNPRNTPTSDVQGWSVITSDNTELYHWPIDVVGGWVTLT